MIAWLLPPGLASAQSLGTPAKDDETFPHTVVPGDSCTSLSRRFFGNPKRYDILHKDNPNMGPAPHHLVPGTVLNIRVMDSDSPEAVVTRRVRKVQARSPSAKDWLQAKDGQPLFKGWRVSTLERSQAEVTFRDESRVHLRENTLVIVYGGSERTLRRSGGEAFLERGDLRAALGALRLQVTTASAKTKLRGGEAVVSVGDAGGSRVSNFEGGTALVGGPGGRGTVRVKPGFGSIVDKGKRPSKPKPLPDAPTWEGEGNTAVAGFREAGGLVTGSWQPVTGARAYRVEIRSLEGTVIAATRVSAEVTRFELHRVPIGRYQASVSTIDGDFLESRPSAPLEVEVVALGLQPPGESEPVEGEYDPGDPSKAPEALSVLLGTDLVMPEGMLCAAGPDADSLGEPAATIPLATLGTLQVVCSKPDSGQTLGTAEVRVLAPEASWVSEAAPDMVGGDVGQFDVRVTSELPLPEGLHWQVIEGRSASLESQPTDTGFALRITPEDQGEETLRLGLFAEGESLPLASLTAAVRDKEVPVEPPPPQPEPKGCGIWMCPPAAPYVEHGASLGLLRVGGEHGLFAPSVSAASRPRLGLATGLNLRLGFYPVSVFGVEVEGGAWVARPEGSPDRALLWVGRTQLVGQLPGHWLVPLVQVGVGWLATESPPRTLGSEGDLAFHYGAGLKCHLTPVLGLRLDLRHVMTEDRYDGLSHHLDATLGVILTAGSSED